ncbi:LysR family transcriptional regulator [Streptomyces tendae]|uniref:LysR family transcriptional regulator n=1 Tax=Streptomyces tendae TaxID=1932 RepID=UPI00379BB47A
MSPVTLRQIEYALAVDEAGAICAAAKALHVAQPSLSQQISGLERSLGVALFERTATGTSTTAAGRAFLTEARAAVQAVERACDVAIRTGSGQDVVVGASEVVPTTWLTKRLGGLRSSIPRLSARVVSFPDTDTLLDAVRCGGVDIAVGPLTASAWAGRKQRIAPLAFGAALPHRAASGPPVTAHSLAGRAWVACPAIAPVLAQLRASIGDTGAEDSAAPTLAAALSYVDAGLGATLVPVGYSLPSSLRLVSIEPAPVADLYAFALDTTRAAVFERVTQEITAGSHP